MALPRTFVYCLFVANILTNQLSYGDSGQCRTNYDYIVIGAGSAGSMVASELITGDNNKNNKVLLIEEGFYDRLNPAIRESKWTDLLTDKSIEKFYTTIEEPNLNNRIISLPRSRVTGGCNSHNAQIYILGNENDFSQRWGNIENWQLSDILDTWNEIKQVNPGIQMFGANDAMIARFTQSGENLGYPFNPDYNNLENGTHSGVSTFIYQSRINENYDNNADSGINSRLYIRRTSYSDFIEPILNDTYDNNKERLTVLTQTRVNKILLNNDNDKAVGVSTYNLGTFEEIEFSASKEVIVCAGTYDTPKILMLSGIGDCDELTNIGIDCKVNIAGIGKNLQDHFILPIIQSPPIMNNTLLESEIAQFVFDGKSVFTEYGVQVISLNNGSSVHYIGINKGSDITGALAGDNQVSNVDEDTFAIRVMGFDWQLSSIGNLTLADSDPASKPIIFHNYLGTQEDIDTVIEIFKVASQFLYDNNSAIKEIIDIEENEISPGFDIQSDEEILEYIRNNGEASLHPAGTCKMGNDFDSDDMVVVNNRLQVKNIDNLRIADASIMPNVVSANTNLISMVIGKRAGKLILEDN